MSLPNVTNAYCSGICRCGMHMEIGAVVVNLAGIEVVASITANGIKWPHGFKMPADMAARIEPYVRSEWLRMTGERWDQGLLASEWRPVR